MTARTPFLLAAVALLGACGTSCHPSPEKPHWVAQAPIVLGSEAPGTRLAVVREANYVIPAPTVIRVTSPHGTFHLSSLAQLRGLVRITDTSQALRFVRLRTSRCYCYDWSRNAIQEVVSTAQVGQPAFADTGCPGSMGDTAWVRQQSGLYGVLSPNAYRQGHFQPPVLRTMPGGYQITRWVCVFAHLEGSRVQKWRETVGGDGSYRLTVLQSQPPPRLPATQWGIMGLK